ncbi:MAG TPA: hypothetical protein VFQ44_22075 [Streptosporangiaceae bacterium]|nr:hypothetical protein [Streptosporangiaceae bacterium]
MTGSTPKMPGLRWVPVPLAVLMAALGWVVFGSVLGQHALAAAHAGPRQGGLSLTMNQVLWMANDMTNPTGKVANPNQFTMPASEMPGMQTAGNKRLRVEIYLKDISNSVQRYGLAEFRLLGPGKHSWPPLDNAATRGAPLSALLYPGYQSTVDLYFDLPASQKGPFKLEWEHGGHIMTIPVHVIGMGSDVMVGM